MNEVYTVLKNDADTLKHLTLVAFLARTHSWDLAFGSSTIQHLTHVTHLDLVDTSRTQPHLAHPTRSQSAAATAIFGADHLLPNLGASTGLGAASMSNSPAHMFLPHFEAFRGALVGNDDDLALFNSVVKFLRARPRLCQLDLGTCPWELVIPELTGLRVLRVRIASLTNHSVDALVRGSPQEMQVIHVGSSVSDLLMVRSLSSPLLTYRPR
jgi:hypothetical protein